MTTMMISSASKLHALAVLWPAYIPLHVTRVHTNSTKRLAITGSTLSFTFDDICTSTFNAASVKQTDASIDRKHTKQRQQCCPYSISATTLSLHAVRSLYFKTCSFLHDRNVNSWGPRVQRPHHDATEPHTHRERERERERERSKRERWTSYVKVTTERAAVKTQ